MESRRNTRSGAAREGPRRSRPRLTARSVIASTLLGLRPPELSTASLVAGAELLGVSPGTARVAMSRMVAAGELEPTDGGYRLAGHLLARQARQDQSQRGEVLPWSGAWRSALVPAEARDPATRVELRRAMSALRYGELRDGAWLRPDNLPTGMLPEAEQVTAAQAVVLIGPVDGDDRELAATLWDLEGWAGEARALAAELAPLQARLDRGDASALAAGFVVAAAVLRHLQADPLLPPELLPHDWPGPELPAARQQRFDAQFRAVLRAWHLARPATRTTRNSGTSGTSRPTRRSERNTPA